MIGFKNVSTVTAFIAVTLCAVLILCPEAIFKLFSVEGHSSAFFIGRRAAILFSGIAVIAWVGRNAIHSESRQAICLGLTTSMFMLALLGTVEYLRGYAGVGILLAVFTEITIAVLYLKIWLSHKNV